jgi:hypothetical protein
MFATRAEFEHDALSVMKVSLIKVSLTTVSFIKLPRIECSVTPVADKAS